MKFEESVSAISHAFRLKFGEKTSSELENLSSASVASTSDYDWRKLYKPTSDWTCFRLRYKNLACSTRYLFTTMFLIDNSKKEEDIEYCEVSLRNSYFGRSEQSYREGTVCINWWYNCKELARKGQKGLYVLLYCENNTYRTTSLMWTEAVLVYFLSKIWSWTPTEWHKYRRHCFVIDAAKFADMRICENDLRFFSQILGLSKI